LEDKKNVLFEEMKKRNLSLVFIPIILILMISGCMEFFTVDDGSTTYEPHPTKISYTITYGYNITCTGTGGFTVNYDCDTPDIIGTGSVLISILNDEYEDKTVATYNTVKSWDITKEYCADLLLGLTANVEAESFIVGDLNGANALTIQQIQQQHPEIVDQYCHIQSNETTTFINPDESNIRTEALEIYNNGGTDNAFIVAKNIFIWLKQNTTYQTHNDNIIQTAPQTYSEETGDCDDLTYLYISLCRAVNIPARFIRGYLIEETNAIAHAWAEIYVGESLGNNGWIPVECAGTSSNINVEIHQNFAIETADHLRLFTDDGSDQSLIASMSGISYTYDDTVQLQSPESIAKVTNYQVLQSNELYIDKNGNRAYK